jgi:hypothetical protein
MTTSLVATVEQLPSGQRPDDVAVTLRVLNVSGSALEVFNPDLGRPAPQLNWPWSAETYRASLLMSYGYLTVAVFDDSGEQVGQEPIETWATPVLPPPLTLAAGDSFDLLIPVGRFFPLSYGGRYRMLVEYGDNALKVCAESTIDVPGRGPDQ